MSKWVDEDELTITYGTLRKAMAESAEAERERIMALLKGQSDSWRDSDYDAHYGAERCIALIKGENNG
jgi:predicted RNA-binding protein associated with RNAse of E/G family